jgi:endonuclease/exonuclease/phosphatase family metal-dependent hydrolase
MADRWCRGLSVTFACCLIAILAGCTGLTTGVNASGGPPGPAPAVAAGDASTGPVRVLQLNLCNSGIAGCYSDGRSIEEGASVISAEKPDLVTLNEVCEGDMPILERALARAVPGGKAVSAFRAARDRNTGDDYLCANGQKFGNGIVSRWRSVPGTSASSGVYPVQDPVDPEERSWACLEVAATPAVAVCTTHLSYITRETTVAQCEYLFDTVVAGLREREGVATPLVLGGDLNLGSGDSPDLASCVPDDSVLVDDGDVQLVVGTPEFVVDSTRTIGMRATDHVGLLVTFALR